MKIKLGLEKDLKLGNLDARRDWCHAEDVVNAMWMMLQQENPDDYIIASGKTHTVRELVDCAFSYVGLNWQDYVSVDPAFYRPDEPVTLAGSIDKIERETQWQPKYSFEKLVGAMVENELKELTTYKG